MTEKNTASTTPNLLVIRSKDIHLAVEFYQEIGMTFELHAHGKGPKHYACEVAGFVFEIYPCKNDHDNTCSARIGFRVNDVDRIVSLLRDREATIVTEPSDTEWGRRAVVKDFDGHTVELVEAVGNEKGNIDQ